MNIYMDFSKLDGRKGDSGPHEQTEQTESQRVGARRCK